MRLKAVVLLREYPCGRRGQPNLDVWKTDLVGVEVLEGMIRLSAEERGFLFAKLCFNKPYGTSQLHTSHKNECACFHNHYHAYERLQRAGQKGGWEA